MRVDSIAILICTYNRATFLRETLTVLAAMRQPAGCTMEILVVDNNSTDDTRAVVAQAAARSPIPITYEVERRQGKSFALNSGLSRTTADVVALTDDDVLPGSEWAARIVAAFRDNDVTFAFGRVLPRWACLPPAELLTEQAPLIWGPLAILDYGDDIIEYTPEATGQKLPVGANLAFAREALEAVGGWRTDLGKVNNSLISGEDHEIFFRLRRAGLYRGIYDPAIVVRHYVARSRLSRRYFRRWFYWHGKTLARMADDIYAPLDLAQVPQIVGVPRFVYRQTLQELWKWAQMCVRRKGLDTFIHELQAIEYVGFMVERWRSATGRSQVDETPAQEVMHQ